LKEHSHAGHHFHDFDAGIFRGVRAVHQILRSSEVVEMLDNIVSLVVCAALLFYLVYAMLRPEKF